MTSPSRPLDTLAGNAAIAATMSQRGTVAGWFARHRLAFPLAAATLVYTVGWLLLDLQFDVNVNGHLLALTTYPVWQFLALPLTGLACRTLELQGSVSRTTRGWTAARVLLIAALIVCSLVSLGIFLNDLR
ncbi:MAG: hypothetical protein UHD09_08780 [Bifidobacterium sp.]|nr:hypothetical protein [Bifidobacterium sp.]